MTEPTPHHPPADTPPAASGATPTGVAPSESEQDLIPPGPSGVIALAALIVSALAMFLMFRKGWDGGVNDKSPPSIYGVNLAGFATLMGFFALYRARRVPGRAVKVAAVASIVIGMAAIPVYMGQIVKWRQSVEYGELARVKRIADATRSWAEGHGGAYPPGLAPLLLAKEGEAWRLTPTDLLSPFRNTRALDVSGLEKLSPAEAEARVMAHSDYVYLGADLPGKSREEGFQRDATKIITVTGVQKDKEGKVTSAFDKRLGDSIPVGFASGGSKYVEAWAMGKVLEESNKARAERALPAMDDFGVIKAAAVPK